jgi:uncharacterized membrane protein YphA (DoxX/SURF4 family)
MRFNLKQKSSLSLLSITIGIVYLWFGLLKFVPGLSPAEGLATETISLLTFGILGPSLSMTLLALWETVLGVLLVAGFFRRFVIPLALTHIALTFTPMLFFPDQVFSNSPFYLTLLGQYIAKNLIIAGALIIIWQDFRISKSTRIAAGVNQKVRS